MSTFPAADDEPADSITPVDPITPAVYANHFEVGFNAFEFLFDFGQVYEQAPGASHWRIVTAPAYAKVFLALLDRSISDYEAAFGTIPELPGE